MKTRIISVFAVFTLIACLLAGTPDAAYAAETAPPDNVVRVHLNSYGEPAQVTMNAIGSYQISDNGKPIASTFTAAASGSGIRLTSGGTAYDLDGDIYIKAGSLSVSNMIQISGSYTYAGDMRIINKNGKLKLINYVDIEVYVMGVLPYEVSNSWPAESLKAQAIAARTYAYYVMNSKVRTSVEHDLVNSTAHQVYYGYNASYTNCINAVNATKNTIMKTSGGQIVYACFSASNGGMTETGVASGAAASNYDYLPLKEDPYDLAFALGTTNYSGKLWIPKTITAADIKSNTAQPFAMLRGKLSAAGLDVNSIAGDITVKNITLTNPRATGPDRMFTGANVTIGIPGASDVTVSFGPVSVSGSAAKYPFLNEILGLGSKFAMLTLRDDGSSWLLASVRYGHGSGLSQIGAYQMAASGRTYTDILAFYYNVGSAATLVVMPWNNSGTGAGSSGFTVTDVNKTGSVNTPGTTLNVRSGPATGHGIVTSLKDKTKVTITGQVADWWRIDLGGGKTGFVSSAFITLDAGSATPPASGGNSPQAPPAKTGTVNTPGTTLNVRSGPGTGHTVIGSLKHGDRIQVTDDAAGWYKLTYSGKTAYVSTAYVTIDAVATPPSAPQTKEGTVNTPGTTLNVRSGPGTGHAIVGSLKHADKITVTGENGDWYSLTFGGKTAYVSKTFVSVTATPSTPAQTTPAEQTGTVNSKTGLNVRSGPGTNNKIIGGLPDKTKITITEQSGDWYKIKYGSGTGWVSKAYVTT